MTSDKNFDKENIGGGLVPVICCSVVADIIVFWFALEKQNNEKNMKKPFLESRNRPLTQMDASTEDALNKTVCWIERIEEALIAAQAKVAQHHETLRIARSAMARLKRNTGKVSIDDS